MAAEVGRKLRLVIIGWNVGFARGRSKTGLARVKKGVARTQW